MPRRYTIIAALSVLLLVSVSTVAQDAGVPEAEEAFKSFVEAASGEGEFKPDDWFDFDVWLAWKEKQRGQAYKEEERKNLRDDWNTLLTSEKFRTSFSAKSLTIESSKQGDSDDRATLVIVLSDDDSSEQFSVHMARSGDPARWRFFRLDSIVDDTDPTPAVETLESIEKKIALIDQRMNELKALREDLVRKRRELKAENAEADASSPKKTVEAVLSAIETGDWDAFKSLHKTTPNDDAKTRFDRLTQNLKKWGIADSALDEKNEDLAWVTVTVTTGTGDRVLTLKLVRDAGRWKLAEGP